ncbi:MAG: glycosyltransferase family protein [Pseudomonadota bacterium]
MKILYGVQGTGNGHITRARAMAAAFRPYGLHVDYLFSGRPKHNYFDMQEFGAWRCRPGLTFRSDNGKIDYSQTAIKNRYWTFAKDVWSLDLSPYDLVIKDFEPISAWAGRVRGKTVISMGHQPAFDYSVPVAGADLRSRLVMKLFAPGNIRIGMHWDSFGAPLLPPLIDLNCSDATTTPRKLLVYLPFEDQETVRRVVAELR